MPVVAFSDNPDEIWKVRGWLFDQLFEDALSTFPANRDVAETFERARAISGLHLDSLDPILTRDIVQILTKVAKSILSKETSSGLLDKPYGDATTLSQYKDALENLLRILEKVPNKLLEQQN